MARREIHLEFGVSGVVVLHEVHDTGLSTWGVRDVAMRATSTTEFESQRAREMSTRLLDHRHVAQSCSFDKQS